ncbi:Hsp33 family molecular chaperone HslO [Desulfobotulus sp.]|jgi:molecular chaperone Hsp33|uniref:Hsp33 family molecular chaperone HslO n=1 Tax=Desulfobotulus sp. TaxID=1940337 RepID=UPI002A3636C9|nr:Hsp33 family molecular chaperone HslO [Desulfobotulus sp.]MDY0162149.1 Hsp33 family molecular chaperone HslO [Desulfobotulus sp.]
MIKKTPFGNTLKEQLQANALDKAHIFLLANGHIRGTLVHATRMIHEMRGNHELGILETLVLGHAYIAACLMATPLKGEDRIQLKIACSGPITGLCAEANALGEVRGYLHKNPIPVKGPVENPDLSSFFGAGILTLTRHTQTARHPFTGQVALAYGNIAQDVAHYYATSEQTPTALTLSIQFDAAGNLGAAGGLLLQAMPGATPEDIRRLEEQVRSMESIGEAFGRKKTAEDLILGAFENFNPKIIDQRRVEFFCRCTEDQMIRYLKSLPLEDRQDIRKKGPFPLEITCHNCNSRYSFSRERLASLL